MNPDSGWEVLSMLNQALFPTSPMMKRGIVTCVQPILSEFDEPPTPIYSQTRLINMTWTERYVELGHGKA